MSDYPSLFRSEEMSLVQLFIPTEVAHDTIAELGELGNVQFKDLNPDVNPFQRSFVGEIRRIDEMARRVRFFNGLVEKEGLPTRPLDEFTATTLLLAKIRKVAESMGATLYPIDANADKRSDALREVTSRLEDIEHVLNRTHATRKAELMKIAEALEGWKDTVAKEKLIYETLNLFNYDARRKTLIAEGWVPTRDITRIMLALRHATETAGTNVPPILQEIHTVRKPPTFHRVNKFTEGFQTIIDSYGVASYQEVNPGLFAVVTFPFLFAVMFGDLGHGTLVTLTAAAMIFFEKKIQKIDIGEMMGTFFYGRYIILLMGIFSMFTGLIYNDIFSKSLHIWHSGWEWPHDQGNGTLTAVSTGHTYPFGLDPAWHGSENALVFTNSYKMKLSIILGVIHMTFACCLQVPNHIHFKRLSSIWAEFLPQLIFLESIFGYLVVCIIMKWCTDWSAPGAGNPPSLLNMLIYMFLSPGTVEDPMFSGQAGLQVFLLMLAGVCVPWMLCTKPYLQYREHQKTVAAGYVGISGNEGMEGPRRSIDDAEEEGHGANGHGGAEEMEEEHGFEMGEVVIHQVIHTIEFCLGCISNTASYLRLWALSLAHAQLSEVLYTMTIESAFEPGGIGAALFLMFMFLMWFQLTVFILCVMEGLSAFLHALRLHWVEANGKHYEAAGYPFAPVSFAKLQEADQ
ncbi:H(+)-transporting V0 sector ATPase subunit a [Tulasnella sp. 403]|nr:H(+)-transporting V0 sector ATPase subunit a [Tulasnella sp. 403]